MPFCYLISHSIWLEIVFSQKIHSHYSPWAAIVETLHLVYIGFCCVPRLAPVKKYYFYTRVKYFQFSCSIDCGRLPYSRKRSVSPLCFAQADIYDMYIRHGTPSAL